MYENMTTEELYTYYELKDLIMESQMSKCERDKLNDFLEEETNHTFDVDNLKK